MEDLYKVLGIVKSATDAEIKKAYRREAMRCHPDRKGGDEKRLKDVQLAYDVLSNANRRKHYDETGDTGSGVVEDPDAWLRTELCKIVMTAIETYDAKFDNIVKAAQAMVSQEKERVSELRTDADEELINAREAQGRLTEDSGDLMRGILNDVVAVAQSKVDAIKVAQERLSKIEEVLRVQVQDGQAREETKHC